MIGSAWKTWAVFAVAGPHVPLAPLVLFSLANPEIHRHAPAAAVTLLVAPYLYGGLQAAAAGAVCAWLSPRVRGPFRWVATCTLVGAGVSSLTAAVPLGELAGPVMVAGVFAGLGAIAAFVCGLATLKLRPRADPRAAIEMEFA